MSSAVCNDVEFEDNVFDFIEGRFSNFGCSEALDARVGCSAVTGESEAEEFGGVGRAAAGADGDVEVFSADGTHNGHFFASSESSGTSTTSLRKHTGRRQVQTTHITGSRAASGR